MNIEEQIKTIKNMLLHAETQLLDYEAIAIETLLTAYEKEKEKNKRMCEEYCPQNYQNQKWEDKIKAKIEELENEHTGSTRNVFSVLQSLLEEKE